MRIKKIVKNFSIKNILTIPRLDHCHASEYIIRLCVITWLHRNRKLKKLTLIFQKHKLY
jgi:hypothetical protein